MNLHGTEANDTLTGSYAAETISGLGGDDSIDGGGGGDLLQGGTGDDYIVGRGGDNTVLGEDGNDTIVAWGGHVLVDGGIGDDTLYADITTAGAHTIQGGAGNDLFLLKADDWSHGSRTLDGGDGDDTFNLSIWLKSDVAVEVTGGSGKDHYSLVTTGGFRITDFSAGENGDVIDLGRLFPDMRGWDGTTNPFNPAQGYFRLVQEGADTLLQMNGDGATAARPVWQTVIRLDNVRATGLTADNFAYGLQPDGSPTRGIVVTGGGDADYLSGWYFSDTLTGGGGNDTIDASFGNDVVDAGAGDDRVDGDFGNDLLAGGDGSDTLDGQTGRDTLSGGAGDDHLYDSYGTESNTLSGGDGNDTLGDGYGADLLQGDSGDDSLQSGRGSDTLVGGDGNDTFGFHHIHNEAAAVTADGGNGNDAFVIRRSPLVTLLLTGGAGSDTYHLEAGGAATVTDFRAGEEGDVIDLSTLLDAAVRDGIYSGGNPFDTATGLFRLREQGPDTLVEHDADGTGANASYTTVLTLKGVAASALTAANIAGGYSPDGIDIPGEMRTGGEGADTLAGANGNDTLNGNGGDDRLAGRFGNDALSGGNGADTLAGDGGNDTLLGDAGSDVLSGGAGNDSLAGGDGNDTLYGDGGADIADGGDGDDVLMLGTGDATLTGGRGDDLFRFDPAFRNYRSGNAASIAGGEGNDTIDGTTWENDTRITISGGAGNDVYRVGTSYTARAMTVRDFAAGDRIDLLALLDYAAGLGTSVARPFSAPDGTRNGIFRLEQQGADTLVQFTTDSDATGTPYYRTVLVLQNVQKSSLTAADFTGNLPPDGSAAPGRLIEGTAGADDLAGTVLDDTLRGSDGDDTLYGADGDDVLDGGRGNDVIRVLAGEGNDTVLAGDGNDLVTIHGNPYKPDIAAIMVDAGTGADEIRFDAIYPGNASATVTGGGGIDTYVVTNLYYDLPVQTIADFKAGAGGDRITLAPLLDAVARSASVEFEGGNPFTGGAVFLVQDGADTLLEIATRYDGVRQTLLRLVNVKPTDLTADNFTEHADPRGGNVAGQLITDGDTGGHFDDTIVGSAGHGFLRGGGGNDVLQADPQGAADSRLWGNGGNDTLLGGAGNDELLGGSGSDSVAGGDGNDTITAESDENDTLLGGAGADWFDLINVRNVIADGGTGSDLFYLYRATALTLHGGAGRDMFAMVDWSGQAASVITDFTAGPDGDMLDVISLLDSDATLAVYDGGNPFAGGFVRLQQSGSDTQLQFDIDGAGAGHAWGTVLVLRNVDAAALTAANFAGDIAPDGSPIPVRYITGNPWTELLQGTSLDDVIVGGGGSDTLDGLGGNDLVQSGAGDTAGDSLLGGNGHDTLEGAAGYDQLHGGQGNDRLVGNGGVDYMYGGSGNDTYVLDRPDDYVSENDDGGIDTVLLDFAAAAVYVLPGLVEIAQVVSTAQVNVTGNVSDNHIVGNAGGSVLSGSYGNDTLDGGTGADTLLGGEGNDTYLAVDAGDTVTEAADAGRDVVTTALRTYTLGANLEELVYSGRDAFAGSGNGGNNVLWALAAASATLQGGAGSDQLMAGSGNAVLDGGTGNDTAAIGDAAAAFSVMRSGTAEALLTHRITGQTILLRNVEYITFNRDDGVTQPVTFAALVAGATSPGNDTLNGTPQADRIDGGAGNDMISGGAGNDTLDGGAGSDKLAGGTGNDTFHVDATGDKVSELVDEGTDTVVTTLAKYTLAASVENVTYTGTTAFAGTGNAQANRIAGGAGNDNLSGLAGNDTLAGNGGSDVLDGGAGDDTAVVAGKLADYEITRPTATGVVLARAGETVTLRDIEHVAFSDGTLAVATIIVNKPSVFADTLTGSDANDSLDGLAGADHLSGGKGDDIYVVDNGADVIVENANEGRDIVQVALAKGTYMLSANVEHAQVTAKGAVGIIGNDLANALTGNAAANTLTGGAGNDTLDGDKGNDILAGGSGDDTYYVDAAGDKVTEKAGEGTDTVITTLARYTLGANVDNVTYTGSAAFTATGNALGNVITGGSGNATIDGGAGIDTFVVAGAFADYQRQHPNDLVLVRGGQQITLKNIEQVRFSDGLKSLNELYVNAASVANDTLTGTDGADQMNGLAGADQLSGRGGDDTYAVDNAGDTVIEQADEGIDTVNIAITKKALYTLADNVEHATVTSTAALNVTGNAEANRLTGNGAANALSGGDGNDTLIGGKGNDTLTGGAGDDAYSVDATGDKVEESENGGHDIVDTTLTKYTLSAHVEDLRFTGKGAFTGVGNALDNVITGGAGDDKLTGGAGKDTFVIGFGNDTITDFTSGADTLHIGRAIGRGEFDTVTLNAPGGFSSDTELVIFTQQVKSLKSDVAKAIGSATEAYRGNETALFVLHDAKSTGLFLFTSQDADAVVSAGELVQIATLTGVTTTGAGDFSLHVIA